MTALQLVSIAGIRDQGSGIEQNAVLDRRIQIHDSESIVLRTAKTHDATAIHDLIVEHLAEGHLLPRERGEILVHAHRFVVAVQGSEEDSEVLACAELAPLSRSVAEARSVVVSGDARRLGVGRRMIDELRQRASTAGFEQLCAFTHSPGYFVHLGFSIVPHAWLPEKIVTDCHACRHFRHCGQYAVVQSLERTRHACVPLAALHG